MKIQIPLVEAVEFAERFVAAIADVCERTEIAGSIRRGVAYVHDVEIVAIPKFNADLFGQADDRSRSKLHRRIDRFVQDRRVARTKNGPRWQQLSAIDAGGRRVQIDLFITTQAGWPLTLAIRTGPSDYSRAFVTPRSSTGLLQNGYRVFGSRLIDDCGRSVELANEREFFDRFVLGGWIEPDQRRRNVERV